MHTFYVLLQNADEWFQHLKWMKVETNDMRCYSNACFFETYAKISNPSILADIQADGLWCFWPRRWVGSKFQWQPSLRYLKISWITHNQDHARFPMRWGVPYRKITHLGGFVLIHISVILAEIWITASMMACKTATSERQLWMCGVPCPS